MAQPPSRRDFLTGRAARQSLEQAGERLADEIVAAIPPGRGPSLLLRTTAMACDFDVMLNPDGPDAQLQWASEALDRVHQLEQQLSVYRTDSEISQINQRAGQGPVTVEPTLFDLLQRASLLSQQTENCFDPTAGALVRLWKRCRKEGRIPTEQEISAARETSGWQHVVLDEVRRTIDLRKVGLELELGAIGKGYAVDQAAAHLVEKGVFNFLVHGGKSSVFARGTHAEHDGWPIGLQNPLLPDRPFATILLKDAALATSGVAVQGFRVNGKRYGHIVDPRTGWPAQELLSVSVIAPNAAVADALSTAFFVMGVANALSCCDNFPDVGAILFPAPQQGIRLEPVFWRVDPERYFPAEGAAGIS